MKAAEVLQKTGITYRQLNYWCSKGILPDQDSKGPGPGKQRDFTEADLGMILHITSLAGTLHSLGLTQSVRTSSERYDAVNELLRLGVDRFKAVDFVDKWLPLHPTVED